MDRLSLPGAISMPNAVTRRTANSATTEAASTSGKGATGIPADSLVRQTGTPAASNLNNNVAAAELRLAQAYDANPKTFAHNLARLSLQELASNIAQLVDAVTEKPRMDGRPGTKKLANSANNQRHIENLAERIMADPTFELLHETARKMHDKHFPNDKQG